MNQIIYYFVSYTDFLGRNGQHYIGLSISFIDDWKLWAVCLSIKPIFNSHTSENIKMDVIKVLDSFKIVPQCYVADNAANQVNIRKVTI